MLLIVTKTVSALTILMWKSGKAALRIRDRGLQCLAGFGGVIKMSKAIKAGDLQEGKCLSTAGILKSDIIFGIYFKSQCLH